MKFYAYETDKMIHLYSAAKIRELLAAQKAAR